MPTVTFLDDTMTEASNTLVTAHTPEVGGAWLTIEAFQGNGQDTATVIGGSGFARGTGSRQGNRNAVAIPGTDFDVSWIVERPSGAFDAWFGHVQHNASGVGGYVVYVENFGDTARLFRDSTAFHQNGSGTLMQSVSHAQPVGTSTYTLRRRGANLTLLRNGVVLIGPLTDPDPPAAGGFVGFSVGANAYRIDRITGTWEDPGSGTNATASGVTLTATSSLIAGGASASSGATANGATLTATASLIVGGGTLVFQAAGMEFGRRTGLGINTFALDAAASYRYTVHADGLTLGAAIITSGVVATDAGGKLPNLVSTSIAPGTLYRVHAIRQADGEAATFRMRAQA
jgi:hypothetical protein